jgi:RimJ/RimL family protein N-acetyltransferase
MVATSRRKSIRRRYADFRRAGESAAHALRSARIEERFERLESRGLVEIDIRWDDDADVSSFLDQDHYKDTREGRALAKHNREIIERDGAECWIGRFRLDDESRWISADSIGGCIGYDDFSRDGNRRRFSGYWSDIQAETIRQYLNAIRAERRRNRDVAAGNCPHCHGTGRIS